MKKSSTIPAGIFLILMLVLCFGSPVFSQTGYTLEVSKGPVDPVDSSTDGLFALPGQNGHVFIKLINEAEVKGLSFTLSADPAAINATGVTVMGAAAANFNAHVNQADGLIKVLLLPNDGTQALAISAGTDILDVAVTVENNTPGGTTANITLDNANLGDTSNDPITPVTTVNERFWFGKKLDVVYNGVVDLFDVLRIIDINLERPPVPTEYELWAADVDDDGLVTIVDITAAMDESVNPTASLGKNIPDLPEEAGSIRIDMPLLPAHFTGKIDLPVMVNTSAPLRGLQMTLDIGGGNYTVEHPNTTSATRGMKVVSKVVNNKLHLLLTGIEGQSVPMGEHTVLTIPVNIQKQLKESTALTIEKAQAGTRGAAQLQTFFGQGSSPAVIPETFALYQNHPNPFNMNTMITFDVPNTENGSVPVKLEIYNTRGQLVKSLVDQNKQAGRYTVTWNGSDDFGRLVSSGVYFYKFTARDIVLTKKLAIMK